MKKPMWTQPQSNAISDEGGAVLVSAAAGSGKTAVLVERAVRLITRENDPVDASLLLILTFTNAAAAELRARIAKRLDEAIRQSPAQAKFLRKQRLQLRRAFIGTIDAFCQKLVRDNFMLLFLPPDIAVGDDATLEALRQTALSQTMEEMYADADFADFAAQYDRARSDTVAETAVWELAREVDTLPHPEQWLEKFAAMYDETLPLSKSVWGREMIEHINEALTEIMDLLNEGIKVINFAPALDAYMPAMEHDLEAFGETKKALQNGEWDKARQLIGNYKPMRLAPVKGEDDAKNEIKYIRNVIKSKILENEIKKYGFVCTEEQFVEDTKNAAVKVKALCRAAILFREKYFKAKLEEKALDHTDFEHLALKLLQDENGNRTKLADKMHYAQVFVDEYQDTNELQSTLYESLAMPGGENLFYVGDIKQSIYSFRKANPKIFLQKKESWNPYEIEKHPCVIDLSHNFRSAPGVIDGVNHVFTHLMSPGLGDVHYNENERLICGREHAINGGFSVSITEGGAAEEATLIAKQISDMMAAKAQVEDKDGTRDCRYEDFCILMRARSKMPAFVEAFEKEGIPLVADYAENVLETPEVLPIIAVLSALDNPGDDVMLTATMMGPLFGFSANEIAKIRTNAPRGRMWGALAMSQDKKSAEFLETFSYYRTLSAQISIGRLCEELLNNTGYLSAISAMESGTLRRENLLRFLGWATEFGNSSRGGLAGFVRVLSSKATLQAPDVKQMPGHVSLMTIHKSKGLEFPFVWLCDAAKTFRTSGYADRVQRHTELGLGILLRVGDMLYPTLQAAAIRNKMIREEKSEEMRLLYVALTRAKQHITVSFANKNPEGMIASAASGSQLATPFLLAGAQNMATWVMSAVLRHSDGLAFLKQQGITPSIPGKEEGRFTLSLKTLQSQNEEEKEKAEFCFTAEPKDDLQKAVGDVFLQKPPRRALSDVPIKISVSSLSKGESVDFLPKRPSFMYKDGLSAAEKGTAQHAFMQFADFEVAKLDAKKELDRLKKEGYISEMQAKAVDLNGVSAFLASELYARIKTADEVLREYDFITAVHAAEVQENLPKELAKEEVLVQGIADMVLVFKDYAEIVDYKTDKNIKAQELKEKYKTQLSLYRTAVEKRLGVPVLQCSIWSFSLKEEVKI